MLQPSERGSIWRNKNFKLRPGPTQKSKARLAEVIGPNLDLVQGDSHKDRISMTRSGRRRHIRRSCLRQRCAHAAAGSTLCTGCNKLKTTSAGTRRPLAPDCPSDSTTKLAKFRKTGCGNFTRIRTLGKILVAQTCPLSVLEILSWTHYWQFVWHHKCVENNEKQFECWMNKAEHPDS